MIAIWVDRHAQTSLHFADLGAGALRGHHEVAPLHHPKARTEGITVDGGNDGLPVDGAAQPFAARPRWPADANHLLTRAELPLFHVGAGRKGPASARDDGHLRLWVGVKLREGVIRPRRGC